MSIAKTRTNLDNDPDFDDDAGGGDTEDTSSSDDSDSDDDEPEPSRPAAEDDEEQRQSRKEKRAARASRHAELERAAAEAAERDRRYQEDLNFQRNQNLLLQQQLVNLQKPPAPTEDPFKPKLDSVHMRMRELAREYEALPAAEKAAKTAEYERKYQDLDTEKHEIIADRRFASAHAPQIREHVQVQNQQHDPQRAAQVAILKTEFADLVPSHRPDGTPNGGTAKDYNLLRFWDAQVKMEMAKGRTEDIHLWRECAENTRVAFKLPTAKKKGTAPPSSSERERFTGRAASGDATGERRSNAPLTKEEKKLARKAYPYLSEEKAYARLRKEAADQAND
jgi:hypothetical protein